LHVHLHGVVLGKSLDKSAMKSGGDGGIDAAGR